MDYIAHTKEEQQKMLSAIGLDQLDDLYADVPEGARLSGSLRLPEGVSEFEALEKIQELADQNKVYKTIFRGAGAYRHLIPSAVRNIASISGFVTAYTPYQAELSQGILMGMFEYQSMIAELTGMHTANASVYDGAEAAAEAMIMCLDAMHHKVLVSAGINPEVRMVLDTYAHSQNAEIIEIPLNDGRTDIEALKNMIDANTACVYTEQPNFRGLYEDVSAIAETAHASRVKVITGVNPTSLALWKTPGECGSDIAVGEGQSLGLDLGCGGPYCGFMACTKELMRKLPGRIVGQTQDRHGNRCYVLTLQAREQHIRREKASSSICSNQALCAFRNTVYMAALGKEGFKEMAENCATLAHYAEKEITSVPGFTRADSGEFFMEFVIRTSVPVEKINKALDAEGILGPLELSEHEMLVCATEANSIQEIDHLVKVLKEVGA